jgi:hypothetical protein
MARGTLTIQTLGATTGQLPPTPVEIQWSDASALGHEFVNTGREMVMFRVGSGGTGSLTIVSKADVFGRLGDVGPVAVAPSTEQVFGPYTVLANWGDGTKLFADPTNLSGSASIAVIKV